MDGVFTDPPYFGNVQYAELMDFCYVWLRKMFGSTEPAFTEPTTRSNYEFTVNRTRGRDLEHFTEGMSQVFCRMVNGLKTGAPFVFTYHHNQLDAYLPLGVAILDSSLVCSAVFPCPAEMGGSIHINGTASSIVDSVFVCRTTGVTRRNWIVEDAQSIAGLVKEDVQLLASGGLLPTKGDIRCITLGHLLRLAVWLLRGRWDKKASTLRRIETLRAKMGELGELDDILAHLEGVYSLARATQAWSVSEPRTSYRKGEDYVSF